MITQAETEFEKRRGISAVEVRPGYAQVHVSRLPEPIHESRLRALEAIANAGISIDFLKLTTSGISFLVTENLSAQVENAIRQSDISVSVHPGRSIVLVYAVNMRDEEGLIASIVSTAITAGANLEHLGDMHDRLLIVSEDKDAKQLAETIERTMMEGN